MTVRRGTALVTGASRRIGAVLAQTCAALGYDVAIHYRRSEKEARAVAAAVQATGRRSEVFAADLSQPDAARALIAAAATWANGLDLLVNNASLFAYDRLETLTEESWSAALASNLTGPVFAIQAFAEQLPEGREGLIINMLDQKVQFANPDFFSYTAGKLALAQLTTPLSLTLAPRIRVCGIAPGNALPSGAQSAGDFERAARATPLGRTSTPEDIAAGFRFIVETPSFAGQILTIDAGESLTRRPRDVAFDGEAKSDV